MDSSPDNDGTGQHRQMVRVRQARQDGVREEPVAERLSSEYHQLQPDGYGLGCDAHLRLPAQRTLRSVNVADREATMKDCGVVVAMSQGHNWAPRLSSG